MEQDLRPSKAGSQVDRLPSPMAGPRHVALHPTPPYRCRKLGRGVRTQLCLRRKRAAKRAPEQEPGQSAALHEYTPQGTGISTTEHPPNGSCLSTPAQMLGSGHAGPEPGNWWRLRGALHPLPGALPSPHQV